MKFSKVFKINLNGFSDEFMFCSFFRRVSSSRRTWRERWRLRDHGGCSRSSPWRKRARRLRFSWSCWRSRLIRCTIEKSPKFWETLYYHCRMTWSLTSPDCIIIRRLTVSIGYAMIPARVSTAKPTQKENSMLDFLGSSKVIAWILDDVWFLK